MLQLIIGHYYLTGLSCGGGAGVGGGGFEGLSGVEGGGDDDFFLLERNPINPRDDVVLRLTISSLL